MTTAGPTPGWPRRLVERPHLQGLALLVLAAAAMLANRLFGKAGYEWVIGALALLLFEIANPILSAWALRWWRYAWASAAVFVGLFFLLPLCAMLVSAKSYQEIGETAMVYLVVVYYPFTLATGGLARLVFFRKKEKAGNPVKGL